MRNIFLSVMALLCLTGCSQVQLASHVIKQVLPSSHNQGSFKVGNPYKIQGKWYKPKEQYDLVQTGIASWYGPQFHGKKTANGEIFNMYDVTAAHKTLQMPSIVRVTNLENGRSIKVRINDRGPYKRGRIIDLSKKSATLLGFKNKGTAKVRIEVMPEESRKVAKAAKGGRNYTVLANKATSYFDDDAPSKLLSREIEYITAAAVEAVIQTPLSNQSVVSAELNISAIPVPSASIHVQAGAFSMYENAVKLRNKLEAFASTSISPVDINGQKLYRVRLNADDVAQADNLLLQLVADGNKDAIIIVD